MLINRNHHWMHQKMRACIRCLVLSIFIAFLFRKTPKDPYFEMRSPSAFCWILRQTEWCDTDNGAVLALVACFFFEFSLETSLRENDL